MLRPFGLCAWLAAASGPRQIKAPKTESWWSHVNFAEQRSLHPVLAYCPTTANERVHNAACLLRLSSLCKSASPLASAIDPRRNSNICNCCSLGRCKDAGASGRSADWAIRRALRNVLPATLSGPRARARAARGTRQRGQRAKHAQKHCDPRPPNHGLIEISSLK